MKSPFFLLLICLFYTSLAHIPNPDINKVVGYVGPACVVVDDLFYLHGHFIRRLLPEEILSFKKYQNTLSLLRQLREAVSKGATLLNNGSISLPTPIIPDFCNGFDDTAEVVLDGCTIRMNHVYIADRLIRPINLIEKQRINAIISSFLSPTRARRSTEEKNVTTTTEKPTSTTEFPLPKDLKELISNALNVNSNVTERFLPVAQMSPLFNHLVSKGENLFEPRNDDSRNFEGPKAQKSMRSGVPVNGMNLATEIPHMFVDERSTANHVPGGQLNPFDPLLLQLLQSLANRQQNVNEIVRQQKLIQQNRFPPSQMPQHTIKAGETMLIGGQPYIAVQLNSEPNSMPSIGLVPAASASSTHTVTALPPMNWMTSNHYGPNAGMHFNGYGIPNFPPHEAVRYHPGNKRIEITAPPVPLFVNGIPLPHEICRAHLLDPFVWART